MLKLSQQEINWRVIFLLAISPMGLLSIEFLSEYTGRVYNADESAIGLLAGGMAGAAAISSLILYLLPKHHPKQLLKNTTIIFWCANLLCFGASSFTHLLWLFIIIGGTAGIICSKSYQILTTSPSSTNQLGFMIAIQAGVVSLSFLLIPQLTLYYDNALFIVLSSCATFCLICSFNIKEHIHNTLLNRIVQKDSSRIWFFISIAAFYACHGGYNAFIAEHASQQGISLITTGWVLTAGSAVGLLTGLWTATHNVENDKSISATWAIGISLASMILATSLLLTQSLSVSNYAFSVILYNFGWCFSVPYQIQVATNLKDNGRSSSFLLFFQAIGMALGAVVLGQLAINIGIANALNIIVPLVGFFSLLAINKANTQAVTK